ncbi:hypothetical protein ACPV52_02730 [Vibrio astriarenae]
MGYPKKSADEIQIGEVFDNLPEGDPRNKLEYLAQFLDGLSLGGEAPFDCAMQCGFTIRENGRDDEEYQINLSPHYDKVGKTELFYRYDSTIYTNCLNPLEAHRAFLQHGRSEPIQEEWLTQAATRFGMAMSFNGAFNIHDSSVVSQIEAANELRVRIYLENGFGCNAYLPAYWDAANKRLKFSGHFMDWIAANPDMFTDWQTGLAAHERADMKAIFYVCDANGTLSMLDSSAKSTVYNIGGQVRIFDAGETEYGG